ncbi:hypothetical protein QW71_17020 [Paenibacillus sp. IHB B 3415]|uniref:hypothetical protein n=1 Tax=Paenibacillus sp. IHB B 3415 TaxID=867080 RepID=UPI000575938A|nr:hypothetical protein [Paenibacillus sp. IHB B 3415]KHL94581.1 hypothetical protein QW71_17020 [Paenibacillus sp. IHB B 3415]
MKLEELKPGLPVRIMKGHHAGKTGKVLAIGTFEGGPKRIGALVDIVELVLVIVEPEDIEELPEEPLPPGWGEVEI